MAKHILPTDVRYELVGPEGNIGADYQEGMSLGSGPYGIRSYIVPFEDRYQFANDLTGTVEMVGGIDGVWKKTVPAQLPGAEGLYVTNLMMRPLGRAEGASGTVRLGNAPLGSLLDPQTWEVPDEYTNEYALVTVTYGVPPFQFAADWNTGFGTTAFEREHLLFSQQEIVYNAVWIRPANVTSGVYLAPTSPPTTFWEPNAAFVNHIIPKTGPEDLAPKEQWKALDPEKHPGYLRVTVHDLVVTYNRYGAMPMGHVKLFTDSVNDRTFFGQAPGTIRWVGLRTSQRTTFGAVPTKQVEMRFQWRPYDWNMDVDFDEVGGFQWKMKLWKVPGLDEYRPQYQYLDFRYLLLGSPPRIIDPNI